MKRFILISFLLIINNLCFAPPSKFQIKKADNYQKVIDFIKQHEGFSSKIYNDAGYDAIGYGCRIKFTNFKQKTITENQADSLLKVIFEQNKRYVLFHYPELSGNKLLCIAHLMYCLGAGNVVKSKVYENGKLDSSILLNTWKQYSYIREFELNLFYTNDYLTFIDN